MDRYPSSSDPNWYQPVEWPVQRLRLGWGFVLFFVFEMLVGRQLPTVLAYLVLSAGIALLVSAAQTIRSIRAAGRGERSPDESADER